MDYFYVGRRKGTSERGDFFVISLIVSEIGEDARSFQLDLFVNVELFVKCENFQRFQTVDCVFAPTATGKARLVEIG